MEGEQAECRCSFRDKRQDQVQRLMAGHGGVFICDECVMLSSQAIAEDRSEDTGDDPTPPRPRRFWEW
ncbi:MAG: ClpX C4-type zinc finger protein [Chloroflexota bacterium]